MNITNEAVALELNKPIELAKTLQRLFKSKDFKEIYKAYTQDFLQSTTINIGRTANPTIKDQLHGKIENIAGFIQFLDEIANDGQNAAEHLRQLEAQAEDDTNEDEEV